MTVAAMLLAGALGAWARYELSGLVQRRLRSSRSWGTIAVNLTGAAALGLLVAAHGSGLVDDPLLAVAGTGFCGAFTTFSTWMVESVRLAEDGSDGGKRVAAMNLFGQLAAGTVAGCLAYRCPCLGTGPARLWRRGRTDGGRIRRGDRAGAAASGGELRWRGDRRAPASQ